MPIAPLAWPILVINVIHYLRFKDKSISILSLVFSVFIFMYLIWITIMTWDFVANWYTKEVLFWLFMNFVGVIGNIILMGINITKKESYSLKKRLIITSILLLIGSAYLVMFVLDMPAVKDIYS